jgi:hypothetical protein
MLSFRESTYSLRVRRSLYEHVDVTHHTFQLYARHREPATTFSPCIKERTNRYVRYLIALHVYNTVVLAKRGLPWRGILTRVTLVKTIGPAFHRRTMCGEFDRLTAKTLIADDQKATSPSDTMHLYVHPRRCCVPPSSVLSLTFQVHLPVQLQPRTCNRMPANMCTVSRYCRMTTMTSPRHCRATSALQ